jgi:hypothetical protein
MSSIERFLKATGKRILWGRLRRLTSRCLLAASAYLAVYFLAVLMITNMSLTTNGLLLGPGLALIAWLVLTPLQWWPLRNPRLVAAYIENRDPSIALSLRSGLDFLERKTDHADAERQGQLSRLYLRDLEQRLESYFFQDKTYKPWGRYALLATALVAGIWVIYGTRLQEKFYNSPQSFGQTHLNLAEGSITIFEPEYTQIPGRTLPLKPGTFQAFPGSRVRMLVQIPDQRTKLSIKIGENEPIPLANDGEDHVSHEFILLEPTTVVFNKTDVSGQTDPYQFDTKEDTPPEIELRSHTPEGLISTLDPLLIEAEVKDDFGTQELEAVITWEDGEKRLPLTVPVGRKRFFLSRNQWYLSDLGVEEIDTFSIYLEAKDNNPINGPGVGQSQALTYELESPEKKYDEFIELAKLLLDRMTNTLGDNLDTVYTSVSDRPNVTQAKAMGEQIQENLYRSLDMTNKLIGMVRETPTITRLDQNFLYQFREGVSRRARIRTEMGYLFGQIQSPASRRGFNSAGNPFGRLVTYHGQEESKLEDLTYELLLQLKMWAILELERQNNQLEESLNQMQEMLDNAENMDSEELMKQFEKLMDQVMKDFQKMMAQAAEQMDMNMQEFMNMDAFEMDQDQMQSLKEQIMEALREGDLDKAKKLMEEMRNMMQQSSQNMQAQMGEMSPEMAKMMEQMREFMGLLREMKTQEEALARDTMDLKREMDEKMGGNGAELPEQDQQRFEDVMKRIHERMASLHDSLVDVQTGDLIEDAQRQVLELEREIETNNNLDNMDRQRMMNLKNALDREVQYLTRDGLESLKGNTGRSLEQTETMQDYLEQGELMLALETGLKLESMLLRGERLSDPLISSELVKDAQPSERYAESREDLKQVNDALKNLKNMLENNRRQFMEQTGENRQQQLAETQQKIREMLQDFQQKAQDTLGESPMFKRLQDIESFMRVAEQRLGEARLDGAHNYEQQAIQRIGELMEQMQQSQQPHPRPGQRQFVFNQGQEGWNGDPTRDFFIPESEKRASKDAVKEAVRKQLDKNLPESYSKEIRKYYEKLMDQ